MKIQGNAWRLAGKGVFFAFLGLVLVPLPGHGQIITQITDTKARGLGEFEESKYPFGAIDDAGTAVYVNTNTSQLGGNPEARWQIFRFDAATGAGQQLTTLSRGVSRLPDTVAVSDDGQWLAFVSRSDPSGTNHDASPEVFLIMTNGTGIVQRTSDPAVNAGSVTGVTLSGSANRIVFLSDSNPLGTNPGNLPQLFAENFNGTGLVQLTAATTAASWNGFGISDDGLKIVFSTTANLTGGNADRSLEIFAIDATGANLRQLTSSTQPSERPVISGDGTKIAFHSRGNLTGNNAVGNTEVFILNWDGTSLAQLTSSGTGGKYSQHPSITDDGQFVYFMSNQKSGSTNSDLNTEIWRVKNNATQLTAMTSTTAPLQTGFPVVAGGAGRVDFQAFDGAFAGGSNPDGNGELHAMTSTGTNVRQLTDTGESDSYYPDITRDGTRIVFTSEENPFGTNPDGEPDLFRVQADGSGLAQVTQFSDGRAFYPSITADGDSITFVSETNATGGNADHSDEIFLVHANGAGLIQLTSTTALNRPFESRIAADGSVVIYAAYSSDGTSDIWRVYPNGTGLLRLTTTSPGFGDVTYFPHVDDSGNWVVFLSTGNLDGSNPSHQIQTYRVRTNGTALQRLSLEVGRPGLYPDISSDGTKISYVSQQNPFGTNADHGWEIFLYNTTNGVTTQLTNTIGGILYPGFLSGDGAYAFFMASAPVDESDPDIEYDLFRVATATGAVVRVGGFNSTKVDYPYAPRPDMTGSRAVFGAPDDPIGKNLDGSSEIWLIQSLVPARISVSPGLVPSVLSWDAESGPLRYDVVRGNVSNLAPGSGGTVSLGAVVCLENDSPDAETTGFDDVTQPAPGQAFFFVYRGSQGLNFGPGSYGKSSDNEERVPGSGGCAP